jgi:formylglycine-generating enzyme required for sulfatase activity
MSNKSPNDSGWGKGRRPVINVSWNDAKEYVSWLSRKTGQSYRLLTEAEWEYAARARSTSAYAWGDNIGTGNANCYGCGGRSDRQTAPIGSFPANAFGLYDLHGNVWERCEDNWHNDYTGIPPTDGSVWSGGDDLIASCGAVLGITVHRTSARPPVSGTLSTSAAPPSVSVLPERFSLPSTLALYLLNKAVVPDDPPESPRVEPKSESPSLPSATS